MSIEIGDGGLGYIYLGDVLIAGGGGESGPTHWTPGANTVAYYKFENNLNDSSGNSHTLSNTGTISYNTNPYSVNLSASNYLYFNNSDTFNHDWTINTYIYITSRNLTNTGSAIASQGNGGINATFYASISYYGILDYGTFGNDIVGITQTSLNERINICITYNYTSRTFKSYINGVYDNGTTISSQYNIASGNFIIGGFADNPSDANWKFKGRISNYIIESKARTATEISDYYNQTKSNYGL